MLPWRQRNQRKLYLWAKLALLSVAAHCMVIFYLCFLYDSGAALLHVGIDRLPENAQVVFMPLYKVVNTKPPLKPSVPAQSVTAQAPVVHKAVSVPASHKAHERTGVTVAMPKPITRKKVQKQKTEAKKTEDTSKKKKLALVKKQTVEKPIEKLVDLPKKEVASVEKTPEPIMAPVDEKPAVQTPVTPTESDVVGKTTPSASEETIVYVGRVELHEMHMQEQIAQEIAQRWKPPRGLSKDLVCQIKATIDWDGKVKKAVIEKPSGVLVYDATARASVMAMSFPKGVWGKELVLHFKQ